MIRVATAGETIAVGARVSVVDGVARLDAAGKLEAWSEGVTGYLLTVGHVRAPLGDTPSRVVRVMVDGREVEVKGGR